jgi:D-aminopeptidase
VEEGAVGAGTGTIAFGWKGGIGTSSRRIPTDPHGYTVGVLVQSNFGGVLAINGAPVGRELDRFAFRAAGADGSIMVVVATDVPLSSRNLGRLATRALAGLARTGASMTNASGDYVIAFSTVRKRDPERSGAGVRLTLSNSAMSPLFQAVAEATEEAIYNSLFRATTVEGHRGTVEALPLDRTLGILEKYNVLDWDRSLPWRREPGPPELLP